MQKQKKELQDVFQLGDVTSDVTTQMHNHYEQLYMDYDSGMLKIANSLWFDKQFSIKDSYHETTNNDFYTSIYPRSFSDPNTLPQISAWIREHTLGDLGSNVTLD